MNKLLSIALCDMEQGNNAVTYNDGQGVKDTIVMTGPLSSIYTKALNLYFTKKELTVDNTADDSVSVATESAAIQSVVENGLLLSEANTKELETFNSPTFIDSANELMDPPNAIIYASSVGTKVTNDELEVIQSDFTRYENTDKDWILYIDGTLADDYGQVGNYKVGENDPLDVNAFNAGDTFKRATESFYTARGIPVVVGFESLFEWLKNRSK